MIAEENHVKKDIWQKILIKIDTNNNSDFVDYLNTTSRFWHFSSTGFRRVFSEEFSWRIVALVLHFQSWLKEWDDPSGLPSADDPAVDLLGPDAIRNSSTHESLIKSVTRKLDKKSDNHLLDELDMTNRSGPSSWWSLEWTWMSSSKTALGVRSPTITAARMSTTAVNVKDISASSDSLLS